MKVVQINLDTRLNLHSHEGESLRRETVSRVKVALIPLDLLKRIRPVEVGNGIQATSERHSAGGRCTERVVVGFVDVGMEVEIFLKMNDVVVRFGKFTTDYVGVGAFVARDVVVVENRREARDVVRQEGEAAGGLG